MKASLFTALTTVDPTLHLLGVRTADPKNVRLPKALLDTYIGQLITAAGVGAPWIIAAGAPALGTGSVGSYYLNNQNGDIYGPKLTSGWGTIKGNLRGPAGTGSGGGSSGADGATIRTGTAAPSGSTVGNDGDFYLNTTTGNFYGPKVGSSYGSVLFSLLGTSGAPGSVWHAGAGAPSSLIGANGDFYLNSATGDVYGPKTAGAWGSITINLVGPGGSGGSGGTWLFGNVAPAVGIGTNGDFYYNTATGDAYGPKTAGVWGVVAANFGLTGPNSTWLFGTGVPASGVGVDGNYFFNTATADVYGPKTSGAWGTISANFGLAGGGNAGTWNFGTGVPGMGVGADGDFYFNTTNADVYGPKASGLWGASVANFGLSSGTAGAPGSVWHFGAIAPDVGTGVDGDLYFNTATGDVYGPKISGAWGGIAVNLTGPAGVDGSRLLTGAVVPAVGIGINGDYYLRTTTGDLFGPKTAGEWGGVTSNFKGADGINGLGIAIETVIPGATHTQLAGQTMLTFSATECVVQLLDPATVPGMMVWLRATNAYATITAVDSNILNLNGDAAQNLLITTNGNRNGFAIMQSDGTQWVKLFGLAGDFNTFVSSTGLLATSSPLTSRRSEVDVTNNSDAVYVGFCQGNFMSPNEPFRYTGHVSYNAGGTTNGIKLMFKTSLALDPATSLNGTVSTFDSSGNRVTKHVTAFDQSVDFPSSELASDLNYLSFEIFVRPNQAGQMNVQFASYTSGTDVTVKQGSGFNALLQFNSSTAQTF